MPSFARVVLIALVIFSLNVDARNLTIFTPQVDEALNKAPEWLWDAFAGIGLAFGTIFAFAGASMLRTAGFLFGAFVGALLAAVVLALIGNVASDIWLPVVITMSIILGLIVSMVLRLARFVMVIAVGVTISGVFVQYGLSYIPDLPSWVLYTLLGVCILLAAFLTYKAYQFMMIFATSFLGGFTVLVSIARFTRGPISLAGMWVQPQFLVSCVDITCWGPFIGGALVCISGLLYQLAKFRGRNKSKDKNSAKEKKTRRELEAAEKARQVEKERFEQRVQEIRQVADAEIERETTESRQLKEQAERDRQQLLLEHRQIEEEKENLRKQRLELEQEKAVVEAEFVHQYNGEIDDLPMATDTQAAVNNSTSSSKYRSRGRAGPQQHRSANRPPPPTPDTWGAGARPWNKCPDHQIPYNDCGCTNPRSKEQVLAELERLRQDKIVYEDRQRLLESRNDELRERLQQAEASAAKASNEATVAHRIAEQQVVLSAQVEQQLDREREELARLLREAEDERTSLVQQMAILQQSRQQAQEQQEAAQTSESHTLATTSGIIPPGTVLDEEQALRDEEDLLREKIARAEGLKDTLKQEIELLQTSPQEVVHPTPTQTVAAASPPVFKMNSERGEGMMAVPGTPRGSNRNSGLLRLPQSKFASKWANAGNAKGVDGREYKNRRVEDGNEQEEEQQGELAPVKDLFSDAGRVIKKGVQLLLDGVVFVIAGVGWAIGKIYQSIRDAQVERQEQSIRQRARSTREFKADGFKERFSVNY